MEDNERVELGLSPTGVIWSALGALHALLALSAAVFLAFALTALAHNEGGRALLFLLATLAVRGFPDLFFQHFLSVNEERVRTSWHDASATQLAYSNPGELHVVDAAIDAVAGASSLLFVRSSAVVGLVALPAVFVIGGWLSGVIVVGLLSLSIPLYIRAGRRSEAFAVDFHRRRAQLVGRQIQILRAITDLRALGAVAHGADDIAAASQAENRAVLDAIRVTIKSSLVTEFLAGVSVGLVAMVVGFRLLDGTTVLWRALVAVLLTAEMFALVRRYALEFHRREDAERAREVFLHWTLPIAPISGRESLALHAVTTGAPSAPVTLQVSKGERVVITGPSGVGKTTLLNTALGLVPPVSGVVRRNAFRVGLVRAENHFLDATLRENLALGTTRTDSSLFAVLQSVGLTSPAFRDLDRPLGDDARRLSTGERVRLAIARAVLHDPDLLILDDVAEFLDELSRDHVRRLLAQRPDITVVEAGHDVLILRSPDHTYEVSRA